MTTSPDPGPHGMTTDLLCLAGTRPHRALDGMTVCTRHADQLAADLRDVEDEYAVLDPAKSLAISYDGGRSGMLASQQAPPRLDVVVHLDRRRGTGRVGEHDHDPDGLDDTPSTLETLHRWADLARTEFGLLPLTGPPTVSGERNALTVQLPRILTRPWAAELIVQVHTLARWLRRANGTQVVPAGTCESLAADVTECGGTIWHHVIDHGPCEQPEPGFRCDRCRRVWTGTGAIRLRHQLGQQVTDERAGERMER